MLDDGLVETANAKTKNRASKPKSRNGCITCRKRRVKCDERRPACVRCEKFGVICERYKILMGGPKLQVETSQTILRKLAPAKFVLAGDVQKTRALPSRSQWLSRLQPSADLKFQAEEDCIYFKTFQDQTAVELSGYFDTNIWDHMILQVCHEEQFAQHAVMALGALHIITDRTQSIPMAIEDQKELEVSRHWLAALRHYGKSLKLARELAAQNSEAKLKYTLLSCLLMTCFENYIGNQENALRAAQTGISILQEKASWLEWCEPSEDLGHLVNHRSYEDNDLLTTFERLETSIIIFNSGRRLRRRARPLHPKEGLVRCHDSLVKPFSTVKEARLYTDYCVKRVMRWRILFRCRGNPEDIDIDEDDPFLRHRKLKEFAQRVTTEYDHFMECKELWLQSFLPLYHATRLRPGSKEFLGASILMIQYLYSSLVSDEPGQDSEVYFDCFLHDQIKIIALARELLENYPCAQSNRAVFAFDDGVVLGLFLTATRCRDRHVRRQAIELLVKHRRREGLWDSALTSKVATWFMQMEEKGMVDEFVPEGARLRIEKLEPILPDRKVIVRCSKWNDELRVRTDLDDVVLRW